MAMEDGRGRREVRFEVVWAVDVRRGSRDDMAKTGIDGVVWRWCWSGERWDC